MRRDILLMYLIATTPRTGGHFLCGMSGKHRELHRETCHLSISLISELETHQ